MDLDRGFLDFDSVSEHRFRRTMGNNENNCLKMGHQVSNRINEHLPNIRGVETIIFDDAFKSNTKKLKFFWVPITLKTKILNRMHSFRT